MPKPKSVSSRPQAGQITSSSSQLSPSYPSVWGSTSGSLKYATGESQRGLEIREPAAVYDVEAQAAAGWPWGEELENVAYSIRIPFPAGRVRCARCRVQFSAAGPTGFAEDSPICDMCLLEGAPELGMVVALVAVVRAFGVVRPAGHGDYREALNELGAFCRIYERFAAKSGPARVFRIPGFSA